MPRYLAAPSPLQSYRPRTPLANIGEPLVVKSPTPPSLETIPPPSVDRPTPSDRRGILDKLRTHLQAALKAFKMQPGGKGKIVESGWYCVLEMRLAAISAYQGHIRPDDPFISLPFIAPTSTEFPCRAEIHSHIQSLFQMLESLRQSLLQGCKEDPTEVFEDPPAWPGPLCKQRLEIIYLSHTFYLFAFARTHPKLLTLDDAEADSAFEAADKLISDSGGGMERCKVILKSFSSFIADNDEFQWCINAQDDSLSFNIIYRRKADFYPAIIVSVSDESDASARSFEHSEALYTLATAQLGQVRKECGAPAFFIDINGSGIRFAGVIWEAGSGSCTPQILPGDASLEPDWGHNRYEIFLSFLALKKSTGALIQELQPHGRERFKAQTPIIGLESGLITLTDVIESGVLYKAKVDGSRNDSEIMPILKANGFRNGPTGAVIACQVSHRQNTGYGSPSHRLLARYNYAPAFYGRYTPSYGLHMFPGVKPHPLLDYSFIEYYPSPTRDRAGWVTLVDLAFWIDLANDFKYVIEQTLLHIISLLQGRGVVHGDLRPNNILLKVKITAYQYYEPVMKGNLVDLSIINFSCSGFIGSSRKRGSEVKPGEGEESIGRDDDVHMVKGWLSKWPEDFAV